MNKFVNAVFPEGKQTNFPSNDDRIDRLRNMARRVKFFISIRFKNFWFQIEEETFEKASSSEEYYHFIAEKIFKIQKEFENKRAEKARQAQNENEFVGLG